MLTPNEAVLRRIQAFNASAKSDRELGAMVTPVARDMGAVEREMLGTAALYTWRPDLIAAMRVAAEQLPAPVTLTNELPPCASGLYLFEEAIEVPGAARPVIAASWHEIGEKMVAFWLFAEPWMEAQPGPFLSSASFIMAYGVDVLSITKSVDWRKLEAARESFDMRAGSEATVRLMVASWLWLKQRVMVEERVSPSSFVRKQADRAKVDPLVRVVTLRRSADQPKNLKEPELVAWSCQWLVRGHWRQQFYPSTNAHHPLWIEPHAKGPKDKPLKPPTETVFKVDR